MADLMKKQTAESFVFAAEMKQYMQYRLAMPGTVRLRTHTNAMHPDVVTFVEGMDYEVDYENGQIARKVGSRIPDWSEHVLNGVVEFNHTLYPDYSNSRFTVFADYEYKSSGDEKGPGEYVQQDSTGVLLRVKEKLARGQEVTYVVYGDSISTGGEASEEKYAYYSRIAARLTDLYPDGAINIVKKAIGGETSAGGAKRVTQEVVPQRPDLVTIGYGMNDQNKSERGNSVSLGDYEKNIRFIVETIQASGDAAIILVTPCEPNPLWKHTSGKIGEYAEVLRRLGKEYGIGVADVNAIWQRVLGAGKSPGSLLLNNINHPNDYGHWLYYTAFESMIEEEKVKD